MANRIHVKSEGMVYDEKNAGAAGILPGMLVMLNSSDKVVIHATRGGRGQLMIVLEDSLQGNTVSDAYTADNPVRVWMPRRGDVFYGLLKDGQDVNIGDQLISAGDGKFEEVAQAVSAGVTVQQAFAEVLEACDTTVSGVTDTLVKMRAL